MNKCLDAICKKAGITIEQATKMIVMNHELKHLIPKKELKKIQLNFKGDSLKIVKKVAKALKITEDAVINTLCYEYLDKQKEQPSDKTIRS